MSVHAEFRSLLEAGDHIGLAKLWAQVAPQMPQPENAYQSQITMHHARTQSDVVSMPKRVYSHSWLVERGLPSGLPAELIPSAERPLIVSAVGIAVQASSPMMEPVARAVERAMADAVEDCYACGDTSPDVVAKQMEAARNDEIRRMVGRLQRP